MKQSKEVNEMGLLIEQLIPKDRVLAKKFLEERNFQYLLELIQSNISIYFRNKRKEEPNEELLELDIDLLRLFENKVILYAGELLDVWED